MENLLTPVVLTIGFILAGTHTTNAQCEFNHTIIHYTLGHWDSWLLGLQTRNIMQELHVLVRLVYSLHSQVHHLGMPYLGTVRRSIREDVLKMESTLLILDVIT